MSIDPHKIYVKFIPIHTTNEELRTFFSICGKVIDVSVPKADQFTSGYLYGFIIYETQTGADHAVLELNNKVLENRQGYSDTLSVVHAHMYERKQQPENFQDMEKRGMDSKEFQDLWKTYKDNEEKIRRIYNNQEEEKEHQEMRMKIQELEEKQYQLKKTKDALMEENEILRLQVKIKDLEVENTKLKGQQ